MPLLFYFIKIMIIQTILKRGSDHHNFCQDFLSIGENDKYVYLAVFDGCSGGIYSHFASALFGKAFKDVVLNFPASSETQETNAKLMVYMISRKVSEVKQILKLNVSELLSTMIFCSIDKQTKECKIYAFGDGFISVDGHDIVIKNTRFIEKENGENMPDYIAYDLDLIESYADFEYWWSTKSDKYSFENVQNISIASDGILTFKKFKQEGEEIDAINYLIHDEKFIDNKIMLERKCNILANKHFMTHTDDLSIIRVKMDNVS